MRTLVEQERATVGQMDEAQMELTDYGVDGGDRGLVHGQRARRRVGDERAVGDACIFEADAVPFGQIGYTLQVLQPGQPNGMYHHEDDQEDFLVLSGECIADHRGQERTLKAWDFVHCPPGTEHIFVGAGDGPCVIFMAGARGSGSAVYARTRPRCATAPAWRPRRPSRARPTRALRSGCRARRRRLPF